MAHGRRAHWLRVSVTVVGLLPVAALMALLIAPPTRYAEATIVAEYILCLALGGVCLFMGFAVRRVNQETGEPNALMRFGAEVLGVGFLLLVLLSWC